MQHRLLIQSALLVQLSNENYMIKSPVIPQKKESITDTVKIFVD